MKIDFVVSAYNEVKSHFKRNHNFAILTHGGFSAALLGSGSSDLMSRYSNFPAEFLEQIDPLNETHYSEFKEAIMMDIRTPNEDMLSVLKSNAIGIFEKNVSTIINFYRKYERDIERDTQEQPKKTARRSRSKRSLQQLVADNKLLEALNIMEKYSMDEDFTDEVIQQKSILSSIKRSQRAGIDKCVEAENKIREVTLELINQFFNQTSYV